MHDDPVAIEFCTVVSHAGVPNPRFSAVRGQHVGAIKHAVTWRVHAVHHCFELRGLDGGPQSGAELKSRVDADDGRRLVFAATVIVVIAVNHHILFKGVSDLIVHLKSGVIGCAASQENND